MKQKLWVFTRYPEPGQTKTRLIPALGPVRAARLQQAMTEQMLRWVEPLAREGVDAEIHANGARPDEITRLLRTSLPCSLQVEGDLGQKMKSAFGSAFDQGAQRVVIVGTDAPSLDAPLVRQAFDSLARCDCVLGPAWDGGYYLIGLRRRLPELFEGMVWGTDTVLDETLRRLSSATASVALLNPLPDVDLPEDLPHWTLTQRIPIEPTEPSLVSVVVPTLNEAATIHQTLEPLVSRPGIELIVVDGGSSDGTVDIVRSLGIRAFVAREGRGSQLNLGAAIARGSSLLFLHADTRLPDDFPQRVLAQLARPGVAGGAFSFAVDDQTAVPALIRWGTNLRSRLFQLPFGDQALFTRADTFWSVGGFPSWPLLEDVEFVRRLRRVGRVVIDSAPALTSARRWKKLGPWRTFLWNQRILVEYWLGTPPEVLAERYRRAGSPRPSKPPNLSTSP